MTYFFDEIVNKRIKEFNNDFFTLLLAKLTNFINEENKLFFEKRFSSITNFQIIYYTEDQKISLNYMTFDNKKKLL